VSEDAALTFKPGSLVRVRGRTCVVQSESTDELLIARPLGGREEETQGVYLPLGLSGDLARSEFPLPSVEDIGGLAQGRILFDAARLSLRETCGPFRCFGKLAFRPRAYQLVPLVMALRQKGAIRLMIADDVGIGKTIEALLVVKELLERAEVKRFAVLCPPHLCEQWREELSDKFGIEAVVIRSATQAALDRAVPDNRSIFQYYPYQVISIDYIKAEARRRTFIAQAPELIIIDEAHSCARPEGANEAQHQRHAVVAALAEDSERHMLFLTATPHSGKDGEFSSLIGLLDKRYASWELLDMGEVERRDLATRFVQRKREVIQKWIGEEGTFPKRGKTIEIPYRLSGQYRAIFDEVLAFARELVATGAKAPPGSAIEGRRQRLRYWTALALLRGVGSSPAAGSRMLLKRSAGAEDAAPDADVLYGESEHPVLDAEEELGNDWTQEQLAEDAHLGRSEAARLSALATRLSELGDPRGDAKVLAAAAVLKGWLAEGLSPVVFCRFIATADYLAASLQELLGREVAVRSVTSEHPDEVRKDLVLELREHPKRVLVATDCLSEGINLQDLFSAVLHYDLPWNPNRLEQREGRVDRFGQTAREVKSALIFGEDNPVDSVVLRVLLRKVAAIRDRLGISIPFPENSRPLMDAIFGEVISEAERIRAENGRAQLDLAWDDSELLRQKEAEVARALGRAEERAAAIRSIFAHETIKAQDLEQDLRAADAAAGSPEDVECFVTGALTLVYGGTAQRVGPGWRLGFDNAPEVVRMAWEGGRGSAAARQHVSFYAPLPEGLRYIGRTHNVVGPLCEDILARSLDRREGSRVHRAAVICTDGVELRSVVLLVRTRNLILERREGRRIVAEELLHWGYEGLATRRSFLQSDRAEALMAGSVPARTLSPEEARHYFLEASGELPSLEADLAVLALSRAHELVAQHERYRALAKDKGHFEAVEPALPPDIVGMYVFVPT
jgi:superfamily II DNA or RNA helicase